MDVTLALLADAANITDNGKLNILGTFDLITANAFPASHPMMQLVLRFQAGAAEFGLEKDIVIRLIDADGRLHGDIKGKMKVGSAPAGRPAILQMILSMANVAFPAAGAYAFHVLVNGEEKVTVPLTVVTSVDEGSAADDNAAR